MPASKRSLPRARRRWYSAPSILSLLAQYGNLPRYDYAELRMVLFAGEVFPVKHLRTLKQLEKLYLDGTHVTDAALADLKEMSSLKNIDLRRTGVSFAGSDRLRRALPKTGVWWSRD